MTPTTIEEWLCGDFRRDLLIGLWQYPHREPCWLARVQDENGGNPCQGFGDTEAEARKYLERQMTKAGILAPSVGITDDRPPEPEPDLAARVERLEAVLHEMRDALDGLRQPEPKPWVVEGGEEPKKPTLPKTLEEWMAAGADRNVIIERALRECDGYSGIARVGNHLACVTHPHESSASARSALLYHMRRFGHIAPEKPQ
ncbi:MAG TPA: hypothetical protein PKD61_03735 [Polyangiaceae bacterium]|nr:hypothetical protein [Polyangiaceae bacterium]